MSAKHTPGPWEISRYTNYVGFSIHAHGAGCIAERWWPTELTEGFNEEVKANANLIAAAPELLEALKRARDELNGYVGCCDGCTCGDGWNHADPEVVAQIDAAIARAEGGQS